MQVNPMVTRVGRGNEASGRQERAPEGAQKAARLPLVPVLTVLAVTMSEGIISTSLYPFLPFMVEDFGLPLSDVGYYAGLLGSAYNFSQFLSNVQWGRLSDVWGRRPVLIIGVVSQAATMVLFGFSSNLQQALVWRCLGGLLNGNAAVGRAVMRDVTTEANRTRGFALLGTAYGFGFVVGPTIGGVLSRPAALFPQLLSGSLLERFPYLLPCAASTLGCYVALLCLWCSGKSLADSAQPQQPECPPLQDTEMATRELAPVRIGTAAGCNGGGDGAAEFAPASDAPFDAAPELAGGHAAARPPSALRSLAELTARACSLACGSACPAALCRVRRLGDAMSTTAWLTVHVQVVLHFVVNGMQELFPLFCANPTVGLGLSPAQLGSSLAPLGLSLLVWPLLLSVADRRLGTVALFRCGVCAFVLVQASIPVLKRLQALSAAALWAGLIAVSLLRGIAGVTSFTAISVIMNNSISGDAGLVNGFAASVTALSRALAPTLMGTIFALCVRTELPFPLDFHLPFYLLCLLCLLTLALSLRFAPSAEEGRVPPAGKRWGGGRVAEPAASLLSAHGLKEAPPAAWLEPGEQLDEPLPRTTDARSIPS